MQGALGVKTEQPITFTLYTPNCLSDVTYYYTTGTEWIKMDAATLTISEDTNAVYRFKAVNAAGKESYESPAYQVWFEKPEIKELLPKTDGSTTLVVDRDNAETPYLIGLSADGTTVEQLRQALENEEAQVIVKRGDTVLDGTALVGTGCEVLCVSAKDPNVVYDSVTVILYGDVDGDGRINTEDYDLMKTASVADAAVIASGAYTLAADVNGDGTVDFFDVAIINMQMSGVQSIDQTVKYYK